MGNWGKIKPLDGKRCSRGGFAVEERKERISAGG
jgi:hypothetical protein